MHILFMKTRRKLFGIFLIFLLIILTTNYVFYVKLTGNSESAILIRENHAFNVKDRIYFYLKRLPKVYKQYKKDDNVTSIFIENIRKKSEFHNLTHLWKLAHSWISKKHIVDPLNVEIGGVYEALKYASIIKSDLDVRGTQLKLLFELDGGQKVVFKPKWYDKNKILEGPVYGGKDRYTSEIVAFYLSIILNYPFVPFCVERTISINAILQVATQRLMNTTLNLKNTTCIYGKCFYCSKSDPICPDDQTGTIPGVVIFNIKSRFKIIKSPWIRTYKSDKKALWQLDKDYCKNFVLNNVTKSRILNMIDVAIFDFFIQNGDRHHYELLGNQIILLDNGKGLGNPHKHHLDILAPLYQCCMLKESTWSKLLKLNSKLSEYMLKMPDIEAVNPAHLKAMDERLLLIYATVEYCKNEEKLIFS